MDTDYEDLLRRGQITARSRGLFYDADTFAAQLLELPGWDRQRFAGVLSRALLRLVEPARLADTTNLEGDLAEAMFDHEHENCGSDDQGCTGGGRPAYDEYVTNVLMPVLREHLADPS